MALDNNTDDSQTKDEHVAAFLEVLRESMGDSTLNDKELLDFARSDMFKEYFPDLVSGIPQLEAVLNDEADTSVKVKTEESEKVSAKPEDDVKVDSAKEEKVEKDVTKEKDTVITLDSSSDSSSSSSVEEITPKGSKHADSSSKQVESKSNSIEPSSNKKESGKGSDSSGHKKDRRDSTHSQGKSKDESNEKKTKHSAASSSTLVTAKKDDVFEPLTDIRRKTKQWKPHYDEEYEKYRRKYNLETHVVVLCDLQTFKSVFHGPDGADPSAPLFSSTVLLKNHMTLAPEKIKVISGIDKNKRMSCARELKRRLAIKLKEDKKRKELKKVTVYSSSDSDEEEFKKLINARKRKEAVSRKIEKKRESSDDDRSVKKRKRNKRVLGSSSDSDVPTTSKKPKQKVEEKPTKLQEKKREQKKQKKREEPVKIPSHLKWEKKPDYFVQERDDKEVVKKVEAPRKIISVSELLARTAKDVPSSVRLTVPQNNTARVTPRNFGPQTMLSDISNQVKKVLCSNAVVEMPVMGDVRHLYDLTVQKIAWWFLKWEQDPPMVEIIHPELHDVVYEPPRKGGYESDESVGHVSDPEGLYKPVFDPKAIIDPDVADEYCGFHSLDAQIRTEGEDQFIPIFKTKPGTNYHRSTFQVKCYICQTLIQGARGLGVHIRSSAHANNLRNRSLNIAGYTEVTENPVPEKNFRATLKNYGQGEECQPDLPDYLLKSLNPQPNSTLISSAKVILDQSSSFFDIKENTMLTEIKDAMNGRNKWTHYLDAKWNQAMEDEKKIISKYVETREKYKKAPGEHPRYADEWNEFWYDRYDEIEASGQDAENYNYEADWNKVKVGKILRILKEDTENEIVAMRKKTHMDYDSLFKLMTSLGVVVEPKVKAPPLTSTQVSSSTPTLQPRKTVTPTSTSVNNEPLFPVPVKSEPKVSFPVKAEPNISNPVKAEPNISNPVKTEPPLLPMPPQPPQWVEAAPLPQGAPLFPHVAPPLPQGAPPPLPQVASSLPQGAPPPLPQRAPPLPQEAPPVPVVPPPLPKRRPTPPKISYDENAILEMKLAEGRERLKQLEMEEIRKSTEERRKSTEERRKSKCEERSKEVVKEPLRSRSKSRERRRRSRSRSRGERNRDKSRRSRSRSRTRRRSRSREERRRSRSRERRRSRESGRKHSRNRHRRKSRSRSRPRDRDRPRSNIRSVERGRTSTETRDLSWDVKDPKMRRAESPLSDVSPDRDSSPYSPVSVSPDSKSPRKTKIPSPPVSKVSSIAFDIDVKDSFLAKMESGVHSRNSKKTSKKYDPLDSASSVSVDNVSVEMELEEGEISPPPAPPGTENYHLPSKEINPVIPKTSAPQPFENKSKLPKRAPPPPILSGSNSLSSLSSVEPPPPGINKGLLPTPNVQPVSVLTTSGPSRGRGMGWTNSYRGGGNSSGRGLDNSLMGHPVPTLTTSTFRGRILHRGANFQRGGSFSGSHMQNYATPNPHIPEMSPFAVNSTFSHSQAQGNGNPYLYNSLPLSQPVPSPFPIDNNLEQLNAAVPNQYSDSDMVPPTPFTEW